MIRPLVLAALALPAAAVAQPSMHPVQGSQAASVYGLSTLAPATRDDQRVCLVEKRTSRLVCQSRGAWRRLAARMEGAATR
ncbi:MAG: hypothetical protein JOZ90_05210 [Alphaproteobacteria bacterium]|nr:hypothetical protein [Alphaproteobacteria bacterium]MBV9372825.1 hypothetical protein [Alphaproteobacteria bacterium]MBV9900480.1 hypothetical protein [Alphaproteobacteria bacterium]